MPLCRLTLLKGQDTAHKLNLQRNTSPCKNYCKRALYQRKVDVDMLNAVKSVLADVSNVSPSSEQLNELL